MTSSPIRTLRFSLLLMIVAAKGLVLNFKDAKNPLRAVCEVQKARSKSVAKDIINRECISYTGAERSLTSNLVPLVETRFLAIN